MDLRQLRYFLAVARSGSLVEAGRATHRSQPALGARIRQLEAELGVELFRRHSRGVELTEAGAHLVPLAERLLKAVDDARAELGRFRTRAAPTLTIGINPTASRTLSADLLLAFRGEAEIKLKEGMSNEIQAWVLEGKLDAGFCYDPPKGLRAVDIGDEPLHLVGPPEIVASKADIPFDGLAAYSLVLDGRLNTLRGSIDAIARRRGIALDVRFEAEPVNLKRRFMLQHRHCTIVPAELFAEEIAGGILIARRIVRPQIRRRYCLVLRRNLPADEARLLTDRVLRVVPRTTMPGRDSAAPRAPSPLKRPRRRR